MSTQHRKPLAAFIVLVFLMAGIVGVQKADARAGRLLAAAVGAGVRVEGALPQLPAPRQERATAAGGPAFEALADPARVHGPGGWAVADVIPGPVRVVGREATEAVRWAARDTSPRAGDRASRREPRGHGEHAVRGGSSTPASRATPRSRQATSRARQEAPRRPWVLPAAARGHAWGRSARAVATATTRTLRGVRPVSKAPHAAPDRGRGWRHAPAARTPRWGTRTHRPGHGHRGHDGRGHHRAASRR